MIKFVSDHCLYSLKGLWPQIFCKILYALAKEKWCVVGLVFIINKTCAALNYVPVRVAISVWIFLRDREKMTESSLVHFSWLNNSFWFHFKWTLFPNDDLLALKLLYRRRDLRDWYLLVSFLSVRVCVFVCMWHVSLRMFNLFMIPLRKIRARAFVTDINSHESA